MKTMQLFTDGSYFPKKKLGSWGFCLTDSKKILKMKHGRIYYYTSSEFMEIRAIIESLKYLKRKNIKKIHIFCDCKNVVDMIINIELYRKNGFKKLNGVDLYSKNLLYVLYKLIRNISFKITHIHSHGKNALLNHRLVEFNNCADALAKKECIKFL